MKPKPPRPLTVAMHLPEDDGQLFTHCSAGWSGMKADPTHFPSPPMGPQLDAALAALGASLQPATSGGTVDKEAVKTAATKVRDLWAQLTKYAQTTLRAIPLEETPPILAAVLLYKSAAGAHKPKPPLAAKHGATSGVVLVVALAILHALTYTFEWSSDQVAWSTVTAGKTRVSIAGLTPGKLYWFRVRAFLRDGTTTDYVHPVSLMVI